MTVRPARRAGLPYNSIEVLVLGNLTNTGSKPLNLKGSWIIVPFSMGVHTQFEGVWKRQTQPNSYFKVFCWCARMWASSFFKRLSWRACFRSLHGFNLLKVICEFQCHSIPIGHE